MNPLPEVFRLPSGTWLVPVIHGSADATLALRDLFLNGKFDCVAVPLPPSFTQPVLAAVDRLPVVTAVVQPRPDDSQVASYVPVDPCQPVIRALRMAREERLPTAFLAPEAPDWEGEEAMYPDAYALKGLSLAQLAAAVLPAVPPPRPESQQDRRCRQMAFELHKLELEYDAIFFPVSLLDWPYVRDAYLQRKPYPEQTPRFAPVHSYPVAPETLFFFLCELPYLTALYERFRFGLAPETTRSIDGIKQMLVETRERLSLSARGLSRRVNPKTLGIFLQYSRNLTLLQHRLRPELATLVTAAQQTLGDRFAATLIEVAKEYPWAPPEDEPALRMGIEEGKLPGMGVCRLINRLPGQKVLWKRIQLKREPEEPEKKHWRHEWNPSAQCSFPPEDRRIESFNLHVRERALEMLGEDLARTEKFTSSVKDGLDIRETLRHWHTGELYVKERPPARGTLEVVVFLFDVPARAEDYPWRSTWMAEHAEESTLVFYATDFMEDLVGPGIGRARYGGAFFLYPPRPLPDVWTDPRLQHTTSLEERLLAGAFLHSREKHVAIVAPVPLKASWRRLARRYGKIPIHLPLKRFSGAVIDRLREFHVLNGREVRSYASRFIRRMD
ncbi:MAG TPA: hypothetical protein ENK43_05760 [Planctomycetes bacterium]|nr:hypothetical protein [Planctomycetota bacterium]